MPPRLACPSKAAPGDKVAVLSPSFAAPGFAPEVHEQALKRLADVTGLVPVEYPTTRRLRASVQDRAADLNAAFADPEIRAVLATIGGEDQITVVPHLDPEIVRSDPKPFLGYSDTPTSSTGCGTTESPDSMAAPPRFSLARDLPSTRYTRSLSVPPC
jgi:muramoyltetrapeptide carboxypeptidase LdcA involved in peptidoglycan recycling